jgi:hypothetical protein
MKIKIACKLALWLIQQLILLSTQSAVSTKAAPCSKAPTSSASVAEERTNVLSYGSFKRQLNLQ